MKINESAPDKLELSYNQQDGSKITLFVDNIVLVDRPLKNEPIEKQIQWNMSLPFQVAKPQSPSFAEKLGTVYSFLDTDKNTIDSLNLYKSVDKKAWWKHSVCNHSYLLSVPNRFRYEPPCSLCLTLNKSEFSFLKTNWSDEKNGKLNCLPPLNQKLCWTCPICNVDEYKTITQMTINSDCVNCKKIIRLENKNQKELALQDKKKFYGSSLKERELFYFFTLIFGDQVQNRYKCNKIEIDVFVPEYNIAIEYDGFYYHKGKEYADKLKNDKLKAFDINVIRVREKGLNQISENDIVCQSNNIPNIMCGLLNKIKEIYNIRQEQLIKIDEFLIQDINGIQLPSELLNPVLNVDCISYNYPEIEKDFHPDYNTEFKLYQISKGSNLTHRAMWWKCHKCNFEWREPIVNLIRRNYSCHRCELQKYKHD